MVALTRALAIHTRVVYLDQSGDAAAMLAASPTSGDGASSVNFVELEPEGSSQRLMGDLLYRASLILPHAASSNLPLTSSLLVDRPWALRHPVQISPEVAGHAAIQSREKIDPMWRASMPSASEAARAALASQTKPS